MDKKRLISQSKKKEINNQLKNFVNLINQIIN